MICQDTFPAEINSPLAHLQSQILARASSWCNCESACTTICTILSFHRYDSRWAELCRRYSMIRFIYFTVSQPHFPSEGNGATTARVYVEQGEIKGRFMSIIMNPMPALITTILDSLKYAAAAGNHLPCVSVLYREQINIGSSIKFACWWALFNYFAHICQFCLLTNCRGEKRSLIASSAYICIREEIWDSLRLPFSETELGA